MPSSSYKPVARLLQTEGLDLSTRAILDTGSVPTLISRQILPDDTQLQPLGEWASMFHIVNEGWLPIVGAVCLGKGLGGQTSYISFRVVDNMSVPAIQGGSFMDVATKNTLRLRSNIWSSSMVPRYLSEETVPVRGTRSRQSARYVRAPKGLQRS